jgi:hypothetical protein
MNDVATVLMEVTVGLCSGDRPCAMRAATEIKEIKNKNLIKGT